MEVPSGAFDWIITGLYGLIGWFVTKIWNKADILTKELADYKAHVAENYVRLDAFAIFAKDIKDDLRLILQKIDNKEDKK